MTKKTQNFTSSGPVGTLREAVEIVRAEPRQESLCLQMQLQEEMAKPLNGAIRRAAVDISRVARLKTTS